MYKNLVLSTELIIAAVTLAILPLSKWLFPTGKQFFMCNRSAQRKIASGKLPLGNLREAPTVIGMTITESKPKKSSSFRSRSSMFTFFFRSLILMYFLL